jgi:hypothetical protein
MKRAIAMLALCAAFFAVSSGAQDTQGPPKPGPEVKRLGFGVGTWKIEGDSKPFGGMPGGKMTTTQKCEWQSGGFFLICHSDSTGAMGTMKSVSIQGYDPRTKNYTYHEFNSVGEAIDATGTVSGDTWTWTADADMGGGAKGKVRVTVKEVSKSEYTFKLEMSQNGTDFSLVQDATGKKVTAAPANAAGTAPAKKS